MKSTVFFVKSGCLLPQLIIFNLFFGWLFLPVLSWLVVGVILILLFAANSYFLARKITSGTSSKRKGVIDVQGQVVEEKDKFLKN